MPPPLRLVKQADKGRSELRKFAAASKDKNPLLADIQRMLMAPRDDARDDRVLHVSEMTKPDWCQRRAYYRITGVEAKVVSTPVFQLEGIWEAGNEIDRKWKLWIHMMGKLRGQWHCPYCDMRWQATSPSACPSCGCSIDVSDYEEVPIWSEEHWLEGHADADVDEGSTDIADDPLVEVKSIGIGTVRIEAPNTLRQHTHKILVDGEEKTWIDLESLWRGIRRPFSSHLKQGVTYGYLLGRTHVHFIYEYKPTQNQKAFTVRVRPDMVEDILDEALDLRYAVKKDKVPGRPGWAETDTKFCKACPFRDHCWSINKEHHDEVGVRAEEGSGRGREVTRTRRAEARPAAEVRGAEAADSAGGSGRRHPDGSVRPVHKVGRPPQRPASSGDDRGALSRGSAQYRRGNGTR